jgi:N-acetylglucosaminyldiphosphoundecaprenol N-acetyl-beta-D-mannosaminyltransferase
LRRIKGFRVSRVYGPDLMLAICDRGRARGVRHFFYGGTQDLLNDLARNLTRRFPGLQVAGSWAPPFRPLTRPLPAAPAA